MTDAELQALLQALLQQYETYDDAARELHRLAEDDELLRLALCRYVVGRMVPLVGVVD